MSCLKKKPLDLNDFRVSCGRFQWYRAHSAVRISAIDIHVFICWIKQCQFINNLLIIGRKTNRFYFNSYFSDFRSFKRKLNDVYIMFYVTYTRCEFDPSDICRVKDENRIRFILKDSDEDYK